MNRKLLLVDDDPNILQGYKRQLRKIFEIETAIGAHEGLEAIASQGPFAVVVSDMQMPEMDGVQFLKAVKKSSPDSVRMMLTGNADQSTAMEAVNDGHVFQFLTKPCSPETFTKALEAGVEQHRLVTSERELLTKTLSSSVSLLTDVIAMVNPDAFGMAARHRALAGQICQELQIAKAWEIEIAAMLAHVGCINLPASVLTRVATGARLTTEEQASYCAHPQVGKSLIAKIPRLDGVAEIIAYQQKNFDGSGMPEDGKRGEDIPIGSRILRLVMDVVRLTSAGKTWDDIYEAIHAQTAGHYDPQVVDALTRVMESNYVTRHVGVRELEDNMVLDQHVRSLSGNVLISKGQTINESIRERLLVFAATRHGVQEPICVRCRSEVEDRIPAVSSAN
ncbi:MAG: response regulator [Pirellulales bacterium]|nr:response regulator [Pirellulales bacterium]